MQRFRCASFGLCREPVLWGCERALEHRTEALWVRLWGRRVPCGTEDVDCAPLSFRATCPSSGTHIHSRSLIASTGRLSPREDHTQSSPLWVSFYTPEREVGGGGQGCIRTADSHRRRGGTPHFRDAPPPPWTQILLLSARHLEEGRGTNIFELPRRENYISRLCLGPLGTPPPPPKREGEKHTKRV